MAGEMYVCMEALDLEISIRHSLQVTLDESISLTFFIDSQHLFHMIKKAAHATEKQFTVERIADREQYNRHEISNVANRLKKPSRFQYLNK